MWDLIIIKDYINEWMSSPGGDANFEMTKADDTFITTIATATATATTTTTTTNPDSSVKNEKKKKVRLIMFIFGFFCCVFFVI